MSYDELNKDIWIGYSSASSHMINSEQNVYKKEVLDGKVNIAHGGHIQLKCKGKLDVNLIQKCGKRVNKTLKV